jgi:threonyl-tRNA synthetase
MERFMGILIEHFAGAFPVWLAPEQCRLLTVSEKFNDYGRKVENQLKEHGIRAGGDYRAEKIGFKIREAQLEKIPYMLVVGDKERTAGTVAVRSRGEGDLGAVPVAEFLARLEREIKNKVVAEKGADKS